MDEECQIPASALSLTILTVVGQCMGTKNIDDARKFIKSFIWLTSFSFVLMTAILMPLIHPLVSLFDPPSEIVDDIFWVTLIKGLRHHWGVAGDELRMGRAGRAVSVAFSREKVV